MGRLDHFKKTTPKPLASPLQEGYISSTPKSTKLKQNSLSNDTPVKGSKSQTLGVVKTPEIIAPFGRNHYNPKLLDRSHKMSREMTIPEKNIWFKILSNKKLLGFKFVKQKIIHNYILDFYCSQLLLCIEIDGESHNNSMEYDNQRDSFLKSIGIKTLRITNEDAIHNFEAVYIFLESQIKFLYSSLLIIKT